MRDLTARRFARESLIPVLFQLSDRLDRGRHDLASAVREFTVRLQASVGDPNPARAEAAVLFIRPLCVAVRSLANGNAADRAVWEDVKELAIEAGRLADAPVSAAS